MLRGLEYYEVQARPSRFLGDGLDDKKSRGIENESKKTKTTEQNYTITKQTHNNTAPLFKSSSHPCPVPTPFPVHTGPLCDGRPALCCLHLSLSQNCGHQEDGCWL